MSTVHHERTATRTIETPGTGHPTSRLADVVAAAIRLSIGWVFLWAFLDKTFGLGHETASKDAWLNGGSPTSGFLGFATKGPFSGLYHDIAGHYNRFDVFRLTVDRSEQVAIADAPPRA